MCLFFPTVLVGPRYNVIVAGCYSDASETVVGQCIPENECDDEFDKKDGAKYCPGLVAGEGKKIVWFVLFFVGLRVVSFLVFVLTDCYFFRSQLRCAALSHVAFVLRGRARSS